MIKRKTLGGTIFDIMNVVLMILLILITFYPIYYVAICSISDAGSVMSAKGNLWLPTGINFDAYKAVMSNPNIFTGYRTTLIVVIAGTLLSVFMTSIGAFLITRKQFAVKKAVSYMMIITMFFGGGMIPTYIMVYKWLHLGDTLWALILPGAINTYNLLIMKANFEAIPDSLEEAAKIDGANDIVVLFRIIMPLSMPIIAVMILFYGVSYWNSWFQAMMYIRDRKLYPLQLILREILIMNNTGNMSAGSSMSDQYMIGETIKYSTIMVATLPILFVYPFVQKYFVKGIMIGAVKG